MLRFTVATLLAMAIALPSAMAKEVNISGSTSVARVMDVLAEKYNKTHPDDYIAVQGIGSSAGITMVNKGVVKIGMSSRYLTESEKGEDLNVIPIAYDGLAIVVNRANSIANLSQQQVFDIYKGKIKNWKEVGGDDQPIAVVTREASSGSRYSFESLMGLTKIVNDRLVSDISPNNLVVNSNSMVKTIVNHNTRAIGFISVGSVDRSVKAIQFEGIEPTSENIANHKYTLARPFLVLYKVDALDQAGKDFVAFLKSEEGQQAVAEYGYTPVKKFDQ
ncbi:MULTISPECIES: phosphate ABC transporter substrate-binding protein [Vibrio]|jgi:phosphate transport system substrate-binding protein|uniref:Phosphate-binding protein n=1 Tax=Vibrio natriegens NBRC 15636 = ATCC 14048 = DSM 759 TaxID=1219067 RepID=A0AAN1CXP1_VIBNA|nr:MULTISPECIES: phosphate ABC transporter substrate-binding protein [Vibrio]CAH0527316.1 Phosphate-binding protein PstS 1 [Catenococcus thiocycli]AEX24657.1 ABC transporter, periplasmic substrate-binding protein [Vibrio sp. EJY3]ALR18513.1 phosphate ABC transporter substrate-binding protein [Vibrio natriegens NBRC 15636 = ATCC 14048 = DSM 759]ANQ14466.1 phosphate ABC transporter substrate-binding protein [Vibrio natriegens NBRC 15636 = ATCC 14048 = DSM 759]ANQ28931.1 phosphate ABC transporter